MLNEKELIVKCNMKDHCEESDCRHKNDHVHGDNCNFGHCTLINHPMIGCFCVPINQ